ncbi:MULTISPECIES: hypothetical protein [unclassified Novosphingobium]|uniref:hypothetical protein n=1 Tax=unclassified Novosphingobium TaxID=2644732 RepID=UPI0025E9BEB1|nr:MULTISPECIES: hypothetical protein [unclassified Novosphingobium]HQV03597.1 hypothetical protein [Novosphingobium sp.]
MDVYQLMAALSWPIVALIAIAVLGPGGVLKGAVGELANKFMSINSSVKEFKEAVENFNENQRSFGTSISAIRELNGELTRISGALDSVRKNTSEIVISQGKTEISERQSDESDAPEISDLADQIELSPSEMYERIFERWSCIQELLKARVGPDIFDGRSVGSMAWLLTDRRRKVKHIESADAELIGHLHSQFKRFVRLSNSKDEWLTPEVYLNFVRGSERAEKILT